MKLVRVVVVACSCLIIPFLQISLPFSSIANASDPRGLSVSEKQEPLTRVALVIGNSAYEHVAKLTNPENDARAVSAALKRLGFETIVANNLSAWEMNLKLRDFAAYADKSDVAVVFYAGHGIAIDKVNYVVPVDARLRSDRDIAFEATRLDQIQRAIEGAKRLRLIILDACRDNPFIASMKRSNQSRSISRGLSLVEPRQGDTLIAFAAKDGTTADDGSGNNSPYTKALLDYIEQPGLELGHLFRKVRDQVLQNTGRRQQPFTYGSLSSEAFYFVEQKEPFAARQPPQKAPDFDPRQLDLAYWEEIKSSRQISDFEGYLQRFPSGLFTEFARDRIQRLREQEEAARKKATAEEATRKKAAEDEARKKAAAEEAAKKKAADAIQKRPKRDWSAEVANLLRLRKLSDPDLWPVIENNSIRKSLKLDDDLAKAARFLPQAVADGNAMAIYLLGYCYENGKWGYKEDEKAALTLYRVASDLNIASAHYELGWMYIIGTAGIPKNEQKGVQLIKKAADGGDAEAQLYIGNWFKEGEYGLPQNCDDARVYVTRAANADILEALYDLSDMYDEGDCVGKNSRRAANYQLRAQFGVPGLGFKIYSDPQNMISTSTRVEIQKQLRDVGLYKGRIDGIIGDQTHSALEKMKKDNSYYTRLKELL